MQNLVGQTLGSYEIVERLGSGGMGAIYRAKHRILSHSRAIKVMAPPADLVLRESFVARFQREAQNAAVLVHPHIVEIYDVGEQDGIAYIVMALLEGRSLRDLLKVQRLLPIAQAAVLLTQLAQAIDYAHQHRIVHRDIKPENVIVREDGHLTLVDFGISHHIHATRLTAVGMVIGTLHYLAPEVLQNKPGAGAAPGGIYFSADLYALGIVAYEMLTGLVPFHRVTSAHEIMQAHISEPPPLPSQLRPGLARFIEPVLLRQLEKRPEHRYSSASAFTDAIADAVRQTEAFGVAPTEREPEEMPPGHAVPDEMSWREELYRDERNAGALWPADRTRFDAHQDFLIGMGGITHGAGPCTSLSFAPDGRTIAIVSHDLVRVWRAVDGALLYRFKMQSWDDRFDGPSYEHLREHWSGHVAISANGQILAAKGCAGTFGLWELGTGSVVPVPSDLGVSAPRFDLAPDGRALAMGNYRSGVTIWSLSTGQHQWRPKWSGPNSDLPRVHFSLDGRLLAIRDDQAVMVYAPPEDSPRAVAPVDATDARAAYLSDFALSSDGGLLVAWSGRRAVIWSTHDSTRQASIDIGLRVVGSLAFAPDGQRVAAAGIGGGVRIRGLQDRRHVTLLDPKRVQAILPEYRHMARPVVSFSPDGKWLSIASLHQSTWFVWRCPVPESDAKESPPIQFLGMIAAS